VDDAVCGRSENIGRQPCEGLKHALPPSPFVAPERVFCAPPIQGEGSGSALLARYGP
jgi:hypothetical protein